MGKPNCWDVKKCGREPGGSKVDELGVCPAATEGRADGFNHGVNGGRACWAIAGTFCGGEAQGAFSAKIESCMTCEFYEQVLGEEYPSYQGASEILRRVK